MVFFEPLFYLQHKITLDLAGKQPLEKRRLKAKGHTMMKTNNDRTSTIPLRPSAPLTLLGSALTLSLLLFPLALPSFAGYTRPRNARPPSSATSTSGARNGSVQLTLLAPQQHVGQSQSTHPTFEWFIPADHSLPGEFQLYEITGTGEIPETGDVRGEFQRVLETPYEFVSEKGFMSFTLPADMEGLKPNTQYIWQVLLRYGPRASDIFVVRSQIEIVESSTLTSPTESAFQTTAAQIGQLSEAGLWYDALTLATLLSPSEANTQRNMLLLELAELEDASRTEASRIEASRTEAIDATADSDEISHGEALRQIIDWQNNTASVQHSNRLR